MQKHDINPIAKYTKDIRKKTWSILQVIKAALKRILSLFEPAERLYAGNARGRSGVLKSVSNKRKMCSYAYDFALSGG